MNIAIYARVSTAQQAEHGYSLDTQIDACEQKARELGATSIKKYVDDGYSGAYLERPALDDLRDALANKLHDVVIIYDTDRLARDTMLLLLITEEIEKTAELVYVNSEYSKTPEGQLFYEIRGSFAKYERIKIQDRLSRGMRGKLRKGLPIRDGRVYGYDFVNGNYTINEEQAEVVRLIFDMYINELGGYKKIISKLYEKGIPSPTGRDTWSESAVYHMLNRRQYTGEFYALTQYHKKLGHNKIRTTPRPESEWIPLQCPAIISKETFDAAQNKLNTNRFQKIRESHYQALFQGLIYCGVCCRKMRHQRSHHIRRSNRDMADEYSAYRCSSGYIKQKCSNRYISCRVLDNILWTMIVRITKNEKVLKKYINEHQTTKSNKENVGEKLERIRKKREAIANWFSANMITAEIATEKLAILKREEESLKVKEPQKEPDVKDIVKRSKGLETFDEKRKFLLTIIDRIEIIRAPSNPGEYLLDINIKFKAY